MQLSSLFSYEIGQKKQCPLDKRHKIFFQVPCLTLKHGNTLERTTQMQKNFDNHDDHYKQYTVMLDEIGTDKTKRRYFCDTREKRERELENDEIVKVDSVCSAQYHHL